MILTSISPVELTTNNSSISKSSPLVVKIRLSVGTAIIIVVTPLFVLNSD
jgi:hypothetical protein